MKGDGQNASDSGGDTSAGVIIAAQSLVFARTDGEAATAAASQQLASPSVATVPETSAQRGEQGAAEALAQMHSKVAVKDIRSVRATAAVSPDGFATVRVWLQTFRAPP